MSWSDIVAEAACEKDEFMLDIMSENIVAFKSFPQALSHLLAVEFKSNISYEKWLTLFEETLHSDSLYHTGMETVETMAFLDLLAIRDRDPACIGLVHPFLYSKGYKALQAHRIAHVLWHSDRKVVARVIQSRCCELYDVDIHPNAVIDSGLMLDHGSGVVIGETACVGKNCSFLHGVTLGSTGKDKGDRHPKIGHDVLIGCHAVLLGNISIGDSCKIGSGSIVLRSLPNCVTAVGNPAKVVGTSLCFSAAASMDLALHNVVTSSGLAYDEGFYQYADGI